METAKLPRFSEIADMRCQEASNGTKTINIKVAINTARMMVEAEIQERKNYRLAIEMLRNIGAHEWDGKGPTPTGKSIVSFLRQIGEAS